LGSVAQIVLPKKRKIAKYAANFDFNSKQPLFNRLQRSILNNPTLTQNIQMLVYGTWPNASKNCVPFFTASYSEKDIEETPPRLIRKTESIKLLFVGTLRSNKKPMLSIQVCQELRRMGHSVTLDLYGDGPERRDLESYIEANKIGAFVKIHGNQSREVVKKAFKTSHFLIFISKSEGWPKVVAESMFWGCVPITTAVSMVPEMLGNQKRGILIEPDTQSAVNAVTQLLSNHEMYHEMSELAMQWARSFTIDKFELEIQRMIENQ
jgi:glycosyltransferase involved in cell wall biosynthesis